MVLGYSKLISYRYIFIARAVIFFDKCKLVTKSISHSPTYFTHYYELVYGVIFFIDYIINIIKQGIGICLLVHYLTRGPGINIIVNQLAAQ